MPNSVTDFSVVLSKPFDASGIAFFRCKFDLKCWSSSAGKCPVILVLHNCKTPFGNLHHLYIRDAPESQTPQDTV